MADDDLTRAELDWQCVERRDAGALPFDRDLGARFGLELSSMPAGRNTLCVVVTNPERTSTVASPR